MNSSSLRRFGALFAFKLGEMLLAWIAWGFSAMVSSQDVWSPSAFWLHATATPLLTMGIVFSWHAILLLQGLYASHRLEDSGREFLNLVGCVFILVGLAAVATVFFEPALANPYFIGNFFLVLGGLVVIERGLLRHFLSSLHQHGRNIRVALILGTGERAQRLATILRERVDLGYRLVGCVDDVQPIYPSLLPWLGTLEDLSKVLSETVVDEVFIALPMRSSYELIQQAVLRCEEQGALVTMPTDFFAARLARTRVGQIGPQHVMYLSSVPENDWRIVVKRGIDLLGALALVTCLLPVLAMVAAAVRLTSPGPVIFKQTRIGLNKRPFTLLKFRTMTQDAEVRQAALETQNEASGPVFKIRNDPRITSIGGFLRRTSLDELPQLFNVIKGEMSLVGPRPLPLRDVAGFREDWQRRRFSVLPGITCLWQLSGRSNISFEKWMELDLQYIDQWSLTLDLQILVKTASVVIKREGAY